MQHFCQTDNKTYWTQVGWWAPWRVKVWRLQGGTKKATFNLFCCIIMCDYWHISACVESYFKSEAENLNSAARSLPPPWTLFKTQTGTERRSFFTGPKRLTWPSLPNTYPVFWSIFGSVATEKLPRWTGPAKAEEWRFICPVHLSPTSPLLLLAGAKALQTTLELFTAPCCPKTHERHNPLRVYHIYYTRHPSVRHLLVNYVKL